MLVSSVFLEQCGPPGSRRASRRRRRRRRKMLLQLDGGTVLGSLGKVDNAAWVRTTERTHRVRGGRERGKSVRGGGRGLAPEMFGFSKRVTGRSSISLR